MKVLQDTLYLGDNGSQTFAETEHEPKTVIIRLRHPENTPWVCIELAGKLAPRDKEKQRTARPGTTYGLASGSLFDLIGTIKRQYETTLRVSSHKSWQGPMPMVLKSANEDRAHHRRNQSGVIDL